MRILISLLLLASLPSFAFADSAPAPTDVGKQKAGVHESFLRAVKLYPDLADDKSELYQAVHDEIARQEKKDPAAFNGDTRFIERLTAECARTLGYEPGETAKQRDARLEAKRKQRETK